MILRDGTASNNPRLDRIRQFDERSRQFSVMKTAPSREIISKRWLVLSCLDQGAEGACVGFGLTHALLCEPKIGNAKQFTEKFAREVVYYGAQENDGLPGGAYPGADPFYAGTSVLAGVRTLKRLNYITSYEWAFGINELMVGMGYHGPAVIGVDWFEGMLKPDMKGFIKPVGDVVGGHCCLLYGIDHRNKVFLGLNSWGTKWGIGGRFQITFEDMSRLLNSGGEAVFIIKDTSELFAPAKERKSA